MKVASREMPPYQYDADVGIQELKYDPRLSDDEIETIIRWSTRARPRVIPRICPLRLTGRISASGGWPNDSAAGSRGSGEAQDHPG